MTRYLALAVLICCFCRAPLQAENRIASFGAEIIIERSGDAVFTETIEAVLEGTEHHGITRILPRRIIGPRGKAHRVLRDVNFVFRGAEPILFKHDSERDADVLRIGNRDMRLPPGPQNFTLQYAVRNLVVRGAPRSGFKIAIPGKWGWPVLSTQIVVKFADPALRTSAEIEARPLIARGKAVDAQPLEVEKHDFGFSIRYPKPLKPEDTLWLSVIVPG